MKEFCCPPKNNNVNKVGSVLFTGREYLKISVYKYIPEHDN
jgi:hypothetical protein